MPARCFHIGVKLMSHDGVHTVSGIDLSLSDPTTISLKDLQEWVIWQFPRRMGKVHYAAVKPSVPDHGWFPAVVDAGRKRVTIYANAGQPVDSPEAASRKLDKLLAE
jgi:hypothetical protein